MWVGGQGTFFGVKVSGSADFGLQRNQSFQKHTVYASLFQPMYTISFADEAMAVPEDFLHRAVTNAEVQDQLSRGTIGPDNPPAYVKSVTYGRFVYYTITNTEQASADELTLAVRFAVSSTVTDDSIGVGADLATRSRALLSSSDISVIAFGGDQATALQAIRTGDFSLFFSSAPPSTAVPISFRMNWLRDGTVAVIGDATNLDGSRFQFLDSPGTAAPIDATIGRSVVLQIAPDLSDTLGVTTDSARMQVWSFIRPVDPAFTCRPTLAGGTGDPKDDAAWCAASRTFSGTDTLLANPLPIQFGFTLPPSTGTQPITFRGTASDAEDGPILGPSLDWFSNLDGGLPFVDPAATPISAGSSFTKADLSEGTHFIALRATDADGVEGWSGLSVTVGNPAVPAPTVDIASPVDGACFAPGTTIDFAGSAQDANDGGLTGSELVWSSTRDGVLSGGGTLQRNDLSVGNHFITLEATNTRGLSGLAGVSVRVGKCGSGSQAPVVTIITPTDGSSFPSRGHDHSSCVATFRFSVMKEALFSLRQPTDL